MPAQGITYQMLVYPNEKLYTSRGKPTFAVGVTSKETETIHSLSLVRLVLGAVMLGAMLVKLNPKVMIASRAFRCQLDWLVSGSLSVRSYGNADA